MKAVEVIDLLSSPVPVAQKRKHVFNATSSKTTSASPFEKPVARSAFPENERQPGKEADEWFCISDDPDHHDHPIAPVVQKSLGHDDHMGNPPSLNPKSLDARNLTAVRVSPVEATSIKGKCMAKGENNFFFLSDDVDGTVDLSDPFLGDPFGSVLEPVAKRRRLTPKPASMITTISAMERGKGISRSVSDVTAGSRSGTIGTARRAGLRRSKTSILDDDLIVFSSSPDLAREVRDRKERVRQMKDLEMDDDDDDDPFHTDRCGTVASTATHWEHENDSRPSSSDLDLPDIGTIASQASSFASLSRTNPKKTLAAYQSEKAKIQKERDKSRKAQEKLDLKEAERDRKRAAKEAKAKEKEIAADLAKVNTQRIDKKVSTPEMIVDLPLDLDSRLAAQVRRFLSPLEVECKEWISPIPSVIKWRRKVESVYNEEMGHWEPIPKQIKPENLIMCVMTANEFVDLAMGEEGRDLDAHVLQVKARFHEYVTIYLVEGLTAWMRKNRNIKNRQFTEAVRSQMAQGLALPASQKGKKKSQQEYVDEDMIEDALLRLQIIHGAQIHHTTATVDTAQWVMVFTQHISTIPYRLQRMTLDTAFCMESGQVKTGADPADTFVKMLQEVNRITAPMAYGIVAEFPTAQKLVKGFEKEGKDVLQGLKKSANKDGAFTDREVGKKISRRLWGIFMGTDPESTNI